MVEPLIVDKERYYNLTAKESGNAKSMLLVSQIRYPESDGKHGWIAARLNGTTTEWETYGDGGCYYWIDKHLADSIGDFVDQMMVKYPDDACWLLFHPEIFEGRYDGS